MQKLTKNAELLNNVKNYPASELVFFEDCAKEIIKCRQVLSYTYVVDYFEEVNMNISEQKLFKYQQAALEESCEQTHNLLESDLSKFLDPKVTDRSPFYKYKADVVNKMQILKQSY